MPLAGQRVLVTRPREQSTELVRCLQELGADVLVMPALTFAPPLDEGPLHDALRNGPYAWTIFTSAQGVRALFPCSESPASAGAPTCSCPHGGAGWGGGTHQSSLNTSHVAAVGEATARALREQGVEPSLVGEGTAGDLAERLLAAGLQAGERVLFPRGDRARPDLPERLRAAGVEVVDPVAYRTLPGFEEGDRVRLRSLIAEQGLDWAIVASPTAWEALRDVSHDLGDVKIAVYGPTTASAVRASGVEPACIAERPEAEGVVEAIAACMKRGT